MSGPQIAAAPLAADTFLEILRQPDEVRLFADDRRNVSLNRSGTTWNSPDEELHCENSANSLSLTLTAPNTSVTRLHLRWNLTVSSELRLLGDAWERSYGDLEWRNLVPERPMPWYFLTFDGSLTHGYGVQTAPASFAFWQCDRQGVSLWLDARNGGSGAQLGQRSLLLATVITRRGNTGEDSFSAAQAFCRALCPSPRLPRTPIYGSNDWYYAYGNSSQADILRDADLMAELAPSQGPRPFTVADEGWENRLKFPSMPGLAQSISVKGVRPGIWFRPLQATKNANSALLLPAQRFGPRADRAALNTAYDPTIPEAREFILAKISRLVGWKYELLKHDYSTFDLLGQWGFEMGPSPTLPGWSFHDRSQTNAEIIRSLYKSFRDTAGSETVLAGCNVVGHLSAGLFETQRTGDDVSGKVWERTRRMGVNTLAFRLPQHNTFYAMDPDCIALTNDIPWPLTQSWLRATTAAGSVLFVSPSPDSTGAEQRRAIRTAFAVTANATRSSRPVDWHISRTPETWHNSNETSPAHYSWLEAGGAYPIDIT